MKNKIKSTIIIVSVLLIVLGILALIFVPMIQNKMILGKTERDFKESIKKFDPDVKIVEVRSIYGNLNGNGNKIGYFVAVLVDRSSVEDTESLMEFLDGKFENVECLDQSTSKIQSRYLERGTLEYETDVTDSEYVSIILYTSHKGSNMLDVVGH